MLSDDEVKKVLETYYKGLSFVLNSVEKGDINEAIKQLNGVERQSGCEICEEGFGEIEQELKKCSSGPCDIEKLKAVIHEWLETFNPARL